MVDLTDLTREKLERLQIEGKLTDEELKEAIRILYLKQLNSIGTEEVFFYDEQGNYVKKTLDKGQKKRKILAQKTIAELDFDKKSPEEQLFEEEFSKFDKLH